MGDLFQDGQPGSRQAFWNALTALSGSGQTTLNRMEEVRADLLLRLEQGLEALNGRRQRANRLLAADVAGRFVVSDLLDVDQTGTSATVRGDAQAVTLRQRKSTPPATIESQSFASSAGTVESFGNLYQVYLPNGQTPTGTFQIRFRESVDLTLLVFDLVLTPSTPAITVRVSNDGVYYTPALRIVRNGARVSAYLPAGSLRFLEIAITPTLPDNIGGNTFTFGLQGFFPYLVAFHLESQLASKPVTIYPKDRQLTVNFVAEPGVTAYVSLDGVGFQSVAPGAKLPVPGTIAVVGDGQAAVGTGGVLSWKDQTGATVSSLPASVYARSLRVLDASGQPMTLAAGLNPAAAVGLTKPVFCWYNQQLVFRAAAGVTAGLYSVSYVAGPATLSAWLRVQLLSRDRAQTPVFRGLTLVNG